MGTEDRTEVAAPDLIIEAGRDHRITAQRHEFSRVEIHEGAQLIVEGGSEGILHLICHGDFLLRGEIVAMRFSNSERTHLLKIPSQSQPLEISFQNRNVGGRGGNGGTGGTNTGGAGALGTVDFGGGGGGGGGYRNARPRPIQWKGTDAQQYVGGQAGRYCGNAGGNGGMRRPNGNGGVVFLNVAGNFDGGGGAVIAEGERGEDGANGGPNAGGGSGAYTPVNGGGGGGGGGPGGHGGFLVAYVAGEIVDYPQARLKGGRGGDPGRSLIGSPGTPGFPGQPGTSGRSYWYSKSGLVAS